jgi:hypothetical protein
MSLVTRNSALSWPIKEQTCPQSTKNKIRSTKKIQMWLQKLLASETISHVSAATPCNGLLLYFKSVWTSFLRINSQLSYVTIGIASWFCHKRRCYNCNRFLSKNLSTEATSVSANINIARPSEQSATRQLRYQSNQLVCDLLSVMSSAVSLHICLFLTVDKKCDFWKYVSKVSK